MENQQGVYINGKRVADLSGADIISTAETLTNKLWTDPVSGQVYPVYRKILVGTIDFNTANKSATIPHGISNLNHWVDHSNIRMRLGSTDPVDGNDMSIPTMEGFGGNNRVYMESASYSNLSFVSTYAYGPSYVEAVLEYTKG